MDTAATNGNIPKMRLIILYFPVRCIIHPANREPHDIDILFGNKCAPTNNFLVHYSPSQKRRTGCARAREGDSFEPHGKEVHDGEVAIRNKEILDSDQNRYLLAKQAWGKDRLWSNE